MQVQVRCRGRACGRACERRDGGRVGVAGAGCNAWALVQKVGVSWWWWSGRGRARIGKVR